MASRRATRAAELVQGHEAGRCRRLRKKLAKGGKAAISSIQRSDDRLARLVDPPARELRTKFEQQFDEPQRQAYAKIAEARFAVLGSTTYPDATFTLRLAFGTVKGFEEDGQEIPPWTTIGGTFKHRRSPRQQGAVRAAARAG